MKYSYYFPFFLFFISVISYAQKLEEDTIFYDRSWHETDETESAGYFRTRQLEDSLYHFWDYYADTKQLQNEGYYHEDNDKRYGLYTWYHKSGKKSSEGKYEDNNRVGKWESWYKNGKLKSTGLYEKNERTEEWSWFYQDGSKQSVAIYKENNLEGERTWWHKSGNLKQVGFYEEGLKEKTWKTYYADGTLSTEQTYDKGQVQGEKTTYYKEGTLRSSEKYQSGILQDETWFSPKGDTVAKEEVTTLKDNYALFWQISGNGLEKPSFLLGTMHIKDKDAFEYSDSLYEAFEACEGYSMEILPDQFFEHRHSETTASSYIFELGTELYYKKASSSFYDGDYTQQDWWIQNVSALFHRDYFDPDGMPYFMDAYLYVKAGREGKFLTGLETVEDHLGTGDKLPRYRKNFDILSEFNPDKEMINTYLEGDIDKIEAFMNFISSEEFNYWLLTVRNIKMANSIDSLAQIRPTFNTVGAAHLPGEEGLIQLLEEKGYTLTRIVSPFNKTPEVDLAEESKRTWYTNQHDNYAIQTPSLIGNIREGKQKWNICMDYLSEIGYAYTLITSKNFDGSTLIPESAEQVIKKKTSNYGEDITEWTYEYSSHNYTLLQINNGTQNLFIRVTSLHDTPTLSTYESDIFKIVKSVVWSKKEPNLEETKKWATYETDYFSFEAPGEVTMDTTLYSSSNYYSDEKNTAIIRHLFNNQKDQYIVRETTDLNSNRYDGFTSLSESVALIYDSLFDAEATVSEVDTIKNRLYLEYQVGNKYKIIQMYRKGYSTYSSISVCEKANILEARNFHKTFKLKGLKAMDFKRYMAPIDSFTVNLPNVEVDFKTAQKTYSNYTVKTQFNYIETITEAIETDDIESHERAYSFTFSALDTLSKINYKVITKTYRPFYQLKDTVEIMRSLFYIGKKDSVLSETDTTLEFYKNESLGVKTRYKSIRNNRKIITLKCTYPIDLEEYVDTNFFAVLEPNWQIDSIDVLSDKKDEIKKNLQKELIEANDALIYNSWKGDEDLNFLIGLKELAIKDEELADKLISALSDTLELDSVSLLVYQLGKEHENVKSEAFWKLLKLNTPTSLWAIDSLTKEENTFGENQYGWRRSKITDSINQKAQIMFIFHKNATENNYLGRINQKIIAGLDSADYLYIPLQDSIIEWTLDLIMEDTLNEETKLLGIYLDYLKECPSTDATYDVFLKCTKNEDHNIQADAMIYLLKNGKNANAELVDTLLEDKFYRFTILKILNDNDMLSTVPESYLTKESIVENQIYAENSNLSKSPNQIKLRFLEVKKVKVGGEKKLVYLYRMDLRHRHYVVMVGYQPTSKGVNFENDLYKRLSFERTKDMEKTQKELFERINEPEEEMAEEWADWEEAEYYEEY